MSFKLSRKNSTLVRLSETEKLVKRLIKILEFCVLVSSFNLGILKNFKEFCNPFSTNYIKSVSFFSINFAILTTLNFYISINTWLISNYRGDTPHTNLLSGQLHFYQSRRPLLSIKKCSTIFSIFTPEIGKKTHNL